MQEDDTALLRYIIKCVSYWKLYLSFTSHRDWCLQHCARNKLDNWHFWPKTPAMLSVWEEEISNRHRCQTQWCSYCNDTHHLPGRQIGLAGERFERNEKEIENRERILVRGWIFINSTIGRHLVRWRKSTAGPMVLIVFCWPDHRAPA